MNIYSSTIENKNQYHQAGRQISLRGTAEDHEKAQADLRAVIDSDNTEEIKAKSEALTNAIYKVSEKMYAQAAAQQQAGQDAQAQGQNSDGTYDADFTEVDDNK